ncbi:hypothetical protein C6P45_004484 [Maudiozyma exigua]|uniref:Inner kinetochore subunit AME1 domain-containing protein n=1 Tax=Maudiozyma exigua TaxID=34358 RepID=A0A9P7BAE2_MAUEX|nr:hypothetical protein C6P45_004484 [Kazachstania exigua]
MDRDTRILYRQRGSNLRKTVDEDNVLVIRTPMKLGDTNNFLEDDRLRNISTLKKRSREDEGEPEPQIGIPYEGYEEQEQEQEPVLSPILNNHGYNNSGGRNEPRSKYQRMATRVTNFTNLPISDLTVNESRIRCYDIFKDLIQFLFKENLMRKAQIDINKYKDNNEEIQTMMYKLDYKIFDKIVIGITKDLNDIKDINIANNILIHNLQRLQKRGNKLNMELINYRTQLTELMTNEDYWSQNKTDQINLQERLKLNQELKQLTKLVSTSNKEQPTQQPDSNYTNLQTVIELIDPQYGIVNKINKINDKLRKQSI